MYEEWANLVEGIMPRLSLWDVPRAVVEMEKAHHQREAVTRHDPAEGRRRKRPGRHPGILHSGVADYPHSNEKSQKLPQLTDGVRS